MTAKQESTSKQLLAELSQLVLEAPALGHEPFDGLGGQSSDCGQRVKDPLKRRKRHA